MTPREIIAYQIPGSSAETCFGIADAILEQLAAAGYVILPAAEVEQMRAERNELARQTLKLGSERARSIRASHALKGEKP